MKRNAHLFVKKVTFNENKLLDLIVVVLNLGNMISRKINDIQIYSS